MVSGSKIDFGAGMLVSAAFSKDGQSIFFILENNMKSQLMKYSLSDNSSKKVTPDNMYLSGYSRSYFAINNEIIFQSSTSSIPSEIYHLKEDQINAITSVNQQFIKNRLIASTELISFDSFDCSVGNNLPGNYFVTE